MDSLVIRIPLPAGLMDRAKIIVASEAAIKTLGEVAGTEISHNIEAPPVKRTRKPKVEAPVVVDGQVDIEQAIAKTLPTEAPIKGRRAA